MKFSIIKYAICFSFEKLHRFVFDNYFIPYQDPKYKPLKFTDKVILKIYNLLFKVIYKDFREYLKLWHKTYKNKYVRYNDYLT